MGKRHSKNAGTMGSEGLTYHEKQALGFGTVRERLGKDSQGHFYECCLTLQPAVDPVITPDGFIFSREAILENLLSQKKTLKRKQAAWEVAHEGEQIKAAEKSAVQTEAALIAFDRQNHMGMSESTARGIEAAINAEAATLHDPKGARGVLVTQEEQERLSQMKAFWLPTRAPQASIAPDRPSGDTLCPASGKKLRLKDLVPIKFTPAPEGESGRYIDPVTRDTLTNTSRLVALKATGDVMLKETYKQCVQPEGQYKGVRIKDKDVIEVKAGGTGFTAHDGDRVQSQKHWTLGPGSGRQDLRGQHHGPVSAGGLRFQN